MRYNFVYYFGPCGPWQYRHVTDEEKLKIAKAKAAEDLAKKIIEQGVFKVNQAGDVEGYFEIT